MRNGGASRFGYVRSGTSSPAACPVADIMLDDSQRMTVILSATGLLGSILAILSGSLTIYSLGYTYDR